MTEDGLKIIFLDVDGVLCIPISGGEEKHLGNKNYEFNNFDPRCVQVLRDIVEADPEIRIVISSYWRYGGLLQKIFENLEAFDFPVGKILGTTQKELLMERGDEILLWIKKYGDSVTHWCAIDDDHIPEIGDRLVRTKFDYNEGLCDRHKEQILTMFR